MKLTDEQQALLDDVYVKDQAYRKVKAEALARAYERAVKEAEREILASQIERDKACARASVAGVPTRQIKGSRADGIGLSTSDARTAREAIENGMAFIAGELPVQADDSPFEWVDDAVLVTLPSAAFEHYGVEPGEPHAFTVQDGRIQPVGAEDDATWLLSTVRVVMAPDGVWQGRIREFVEGAE